MPLYLRWLAGRVEALGGTITRLNLSALPTGADVVVNCTGLGRAARWRPISTSSRCGTGRRVEQFGLERWWLDPAGPTYVVPRSRDVVVGGTEVHGEWSRSPSPATAAEILDRAAALVPAVRDARVLRHKVGLRPARPTVRVERTGDVVHCYGHGGSGVTLSWGTADDVVGARRLEALGVHDRVGVERDRRCAGSCRRRPRRPATGRSAGRCRW